MMQTAIKEVKVATGFRADEISKNFLEAAVGNTPLDPPSKRYQRPAGERRSLRQS